MTALRMAHRIGYRRDGLLSFAGVAVLPWR
jgi:hypothetical protein